MCAVMMLMLMRCAAWCASGGASCSSSVRLGEAGDIASTGAGSANTVAGAEVGRKHRGRPPVSRNRWAVGLYVATSLLGCAGHTQGGTRAGVGVGKLVDEQGLYLGSSGKYSGSVRQASIKL